MTPEEIIKKVTCNGMRESTEARVIKALEEYGKQQWNEAIDAVAENAEVKKIESPHGEWLDEWVIDTESILKLKKK